MIEAAAIVLAAGKSTRMKSSLPKVMHEICGRPMLGYVLQACRLAGVDRLIVVVGYDKEKVVERFAEEPDFEIEWIEQTEQHGTGHAVLCCRAALKGFSGSVLVVAGDMPLVHRETLSRLLELRARSGDAVTLATALLEDPTGYGRIVRDSEGRLEAIVEHRDCTEEQREIHEVNPSYYCFDADRLFQSLDAVESDPETGEYYVTDAVRLLREAGHGVSAEVGIPAADAQGVNSRGDLVTVNRAMQDRIQLSLMEDGVTIVDPDNTWIEAGVTIGSDTTIYPFTFVGTGAVIGESCRIGPLARVGAGETVPDGAVVGCATTVGARAS